MTDARALLAAMEGGNGVGGATEFPPALTVRKLLDAPEPEDVYIAEPLVPADANLLMAGYPKTHKTNFVLELAVSAAAGVPFLGRFLVPRRHRVGLIFMEDRAHRIRRRIVRLCQGHGVHPEDLAVHFWFRPPLLLGSPAIMEQLSRYVGEYQLDVLMVDSWIYV
ncbi:MAG: AAA family ATPase, partial [Gemmatimonadetes bacterium]|nr:AAA family ATPase [Gemmatimonadota bacterium]